jgi:hypothetical protein
VNGCLRVLFPLFVFFLGSQQTRDERCLCLQVRYQVPYKVINFLDLRTDLGLYVIDFLTPPSDYLEAFSNRGVPFFQSLFQLGPDVVESGLRFLGKGV